MRVIRTMQVRQSVTLVICINMGRLKHCKEGHWPNVAISLQSPGYCHNMSSIVCRLSVTRVYRDNTAKDRIMQFSLKYSPMPYFFAVKFDDEIRRGSSWSRGLKLEWGGFRIRDAISRKRCEMQLKWELITNRKSYVGFRLQQKSMTLNDFERQFNAV